MKGMVFVELLNMAEAAIGEDAVDEILDRAELASDGAYSAVGNYSCGELIKLVEAIGLHVKASPEDLQTQFGHWMFRRFVEGYPGFFTDKADAFDMLEAIENEVHVEVRKLYPEVELPHFSTERFGGDRLQMVYRSERPLTHFCLGLIQACITHFGEPAEVDMVPLEGETQHAAEFIFRKAA